MPQRESGALPTSDSLSESEDMELTVKRQEPLKDGGNLSLTGNSIGRNKVGLKPGRSLMDWIRLTHASTDLAGTGGETMVVTVQELQKHNSGNDAWICINGKVYNVTPYLEFHPGGESELMRGVGKDATDLFNQIHRWVNAESMLQKCYVGPLQSSSLWLQPSPVIKKKIVKSSISDKPALATPTSENSCLDLKVHFNQTEDCVHIIVDEVEETVQKHQIIIDLTEKTLIIILKLEKHVYQCNIELTDVVSDDYIVNINEENSVLQITLSKIVKELWPDMGSIQLKVISPDEIDIYRPCILLKRIPVNYNTLLLSFQLPAGSIMHVPIGHHIHVKDIISDVEIVRSYTPIVPSLFTPVTDTMITDGRHLYLMVKIYSSGALTPILHVCEIGNSVFMSNYTGNFSLSKLNSYPLLIMLAAGTGFTPMIKIIHHLSQPGQEMKMFLYFFNRTERDILWKDELDLLSQKVERFSVCHILSEPSKGWQGESGMISRQLLEIIFPTPALRAETFICICGSVEFSKAALQYLEELNYLSENIHAFTG